MPQRSVRFPDELHAALEAEATVRGKPHTFSSVLIEWAERGRGPALEAALLDDTQAGGPRAADGHRTRETASAIGAVTARGASRPAASPRAPAAAHPNVVASPALARFAGGTPKKAKGAKR